MPLVRLISIALLTLFLFNMIGYYGVYVALRAKVNSELREKLDADNFDESETIVIKVPLSLPYQTDWTSFQRVDGDFERDGKFYNLVKQKIERDTLTIIAVRDHEEATLFESLVEFVQSNTDNPISKNTGKLIENFAKDFLCSSSGLTTASIGWIAEPAFVVPHYSVIHSFQKVHTPPPRA